MKKKIRTSLTCSATVAFAIPLFAIASPMMQNGVHGSALGQNAQAPGVYKVGGDVSAPVVIHSVDPEYTEAALKAKVSGSVLMTIYVDTHGNPSHIRVNRGLGQGLDQKAVEAVHQYKFKPATKDGKPVLVEISLEVNFQEPANWSH
jgi:periplasmic protein TonB